MFAPMAADDLLSAVAPFPVRFNLCSYYLDRNVEEARGGKTALMTAAVGGDVNGDGFSDVFVGAGISLNFSQAGFVEGFFAVPPP